MAWKEMANSTPAEIQLSGRTKDLLIESMKDMLRQSELRLLVLGDC